MFGQIFRVVWLTGIKEASFCVRFYREKIRMIKRLLGSSIVALSLCLTGCASFIEHTTYSTETEVGSHRTGQVHWVLSTLEDKRKKMIGFDKEVPAQYQNETWAYVRFTNYAYLVITYSWAIVPPGMAVKDGDTVELVMGGRKPFVPNRIVKVIAHAQ